VFQMLYNSVTIAYSSRSDGDNIPRLILSHWMDLTTEIADA